MTDLPAACPAFDAGIDPFGVHTSRCWANDKNRIQCQLTVPTDPAHVGLCANHVEQFRTEFPV